MGPEKEEQIASGNPALQLQRRPASNRIVHGTEALSSLRASVALLVDISATPDIGYSSEDLRLMLAFSGMPQCISV